MSMVCDPCPWVTICYQVAPWCLDLAGGKTQLISILGIWCLPILGFDSSKSDLCILVFWFGLGFLNSWSSCWLFPFSSVPVWLRTGARWKCLWSLCPLYNWLLSFLFLFQLFLCTWGIVLNANFGFFYFPCRASKIFLLHIACFVVLWWCCRGFHIILSLSCGLCSRCSLAWCIFLG